MPARFCFRCGTKALAGARFCSDCGASLAGGTGAGESRQLTALGATFLSLFLAGGLAIWTLILSPASPRPEPGGTASRTTPPAVAGAATKLPEGHPQVPVQLPDDVKKFIADLGAKAKKSPKDTDAWLKLATVNARAAQLDASYSTDALAAFQHVLELDPRNADALRGLANLHYDRDEHRDAIPLFERYLELRPDDASARTDLATMYLYAGDTGRAISSYQDVIKRNPSFLQAHYNLAVAYHRQGDDAAALGELATARGFAADDDARKQIDDMIASLRGEPSTSGASNNGPAAARSPFQAAVEAAFRAHPIMGPRIVRFEWSAPATGRALVQNFPMDGMPPAVREKFAAHLAEQLRTATHDHGVQGPVRVEIADAASGVVMAAVTP
jgi:tetratricopeptide (TPR) repeat protein